MNLVDLNPDLKSGVFQFLSIESFVSLKRTCKRAVNPAQDAIYWKKMWNCFYSSINAQNDRVQIKTFEEELKKQRLLSKKFQVCVQLKCEKMGSFKGCLKNAEPIILTTCLRDLVKKI